MSRITLILFYSYIGIFFFLQFVDIKTRWETASDTGRQSRQTAGERDDEGAGWGKNGLKQKNNIFIWPNEVTRDMTTNT